jgi:PhnB protein
MEVKRQTITPSLTVNDAEAAIAFYEKVFGARTLPHIMRGPGGKGVMHAELLFADMKLFINGEFPPMGAYSPTHYGGSSVNLQLAVANCDETYKAAIAAGATSRLEPHDAFWGDRYAFVTDPWGHGWGISSILEVLAPEQQQERAEKMFGK